MVILSCISKLLGNDFYFEDETITPCFRPGFLLDCGIYWVQNLRRFLVGGAVVGNSDKVMSHKCDQVCRASELPIYIYEESMGVRQGGTALCPAKPGMIEKSVRQVRQGIWSVIESVTHYRNDAEQKVREQASKASSMVKYMSEECDEKTRMGAVGVGVLAGFLMGMRGGLFRKLLYAGTGGFAMSALCYPHQTYEYTQQGLQETKRMVKITYNFIYGVNGSNKPNEEFQFPKLPTSFDEAWLKVTEFGKSTTALITAKEEKKVIRKIPDPETVVSESLHAAEESCDCPIGVCLGRHDKAIADP